MTALNKPWVTSLQSSLLRQLCVGYPTMSPCQAVCVRSWPGWPWPLLSPFPSPCRPGQGQVRLYGNWALWFIVTCRCHSSDQLSSSSLSLGWYTKRSVIYLPFQCMVWSCELSEMTVIGICCLFLLEVAGRLQGLQQAHWYSLIWLSRWLCLNLATYFNSYGKQKDWEKQSASADFSDFVVNLWNQLHTSNQ